MARQIILILLLLINSLAFSRYNNPRNRLFIMELNKGVQSWNKYIRGRKLSDRWSVIMSYAKFRNKNFDNIDLAGVKFDFLSLENVKMRKSNLNNASFHTLEIRNTDFSFSKINKVRFSTLNCENSKFVNISFMNSELTGDRFYNIDFSYSNFTDSSIAVVLFNNSNFFKCTFKSIQIKSNTKFSCGNFTKTDFRAAEFIFSDKDKKRGYSKILFMGCNFTNANLTGIAQLDNAAFTYSDMNGAKIERKWFNYLKTQEVKNFDKIRWQ